ncbi:hypothetical protein M5K25_017059 [Dendrobium thyrsiflorum]|uniref:Uncharacterized protein n=1 Tax=Dendrobium thyrsiflorum TaxID=117978 RepID=A0ABD0UTP2_DENTH
MIAKAFSSSSSSSTAAAAASSPLARISPHLKLKFLRVAYQLSCHRRSRSIRGRAIEPSNDAASPQPRHGAAFLELNRSKVLVPAASPLRAI